MDNIYSKIFILLLVGLFQTGLYEAVQKPIALAENIEEITHVVSPLSAIKAEIALKPYNFFSFGVADKNAHFFFNEKLEESLSLDIKLQPPRV